MIKLVRLDNVEIYLNPRIMETVESTPDTLITLTNGKKVMVRDTLEEVVKKFLHFEALIGRLRVKSEPVEKVDDVSS